MKAKLSETLLPCPFCGGLPIIIYAPTNDDAGIPCYGVACKKCNVMIGTNKDGVTDFFRTAVEAANTWNNRYIMPIEFVIKENENEN